jgi:tetratricopeptide (TPR) repeat protein
LKGATVIIGVIVFLFGVQTVFAQAPGGEGEPSPHDWWYTLERGKVMFRQGDYGNALLAFEDARRQRKAMYERLERHFINLLSISAVRRMDDSLERVERYIDERRYADAGEALAELYYRIPRATFNNSASAALTALGTLKEYPEAEYWIGEIFLVEGELKLAQDQFQKTLALKGTFENPGLATDLLYKIAAILRIRQEYNEMERTLLSILETDRLWAGQEIRTEDPYRDRGEDAVASRLSFAKQAMTRTLENNGINRYLTLYRYKSIETVEAHRLLGYYYYASGRHSRAQEHLMFAFLIQNTVIIDELIRKQYDFAFTTLEALTFEISRNKQLGEYAEKNEYFKIAYYLGASLYGNGKTAAARDLWNPLSTQTHIGEWQSRSLAQLAAPHVERALEMP